MKQLKLPRPRPVPKLSEEARPPLSHRGATADSDRAKRPRLASPIPAGQELNPGDRVEALGNFGKPTGNMGTVLQTNEEDAVVKWDGCGEMRLGQAWLKKINPGSTKPNPGVRNPGSENLLSPERPRKGARIRLRGPNVSAIELTTLPTLHKVWR